MSSLRLRGIRKTFSGTTVLHGIDARGLAMVFQSYALYPHMTVAENISFGLRMLATPKAEIEIERAVAAAAAVLQIVPLLQRLPGSYRAGSASAWRSAARSCAGRASSVRRAVVDPGRELDIDAPQLHAGDAVTIGIRPEPLATVSQPPAGRAALAVTVQLVEHLGDVVYVHAVTACGTSLTARAAHDTALHTGSPALLTFAQADALLFDDTGRALRPAP